MRFAVRLILFFAVTLVGIQAATIVSIKAVLRATLMEDGQSQVAAAEDRFLRQLSEQEARLAEGVRLLTLDFALRQAIADRDSATVLSALRNHGRRIGVSRMQLVAPGGAIDGDTAADPTGDFPYLELLDRAASGDRAGAVAIMDGKPVWLVVVPVMAPDPIAFVAAAIPLDDAELTRIRDLAGGPGRIGIAMLTPGGWIALTGGIAGESLKDLRDDGAGRAIAGPGGEETIVIARRLPTPAAVPPMRIVLDYPLSEALSRYHNLSLVVVPILFVGLVAALAGAIVISRGVARPIEILARQTRRIAAGNYTPPPLLNRSDELGQLSAALRRMTGAIAEREESVRYRASHDPVTGMINRVAMMGEIETAFARGGGAILVVGLIRWRDITSTAGHDVGDRLLLEAARRIAGGFDNDPGRRPAARIGEDTFAVLLPGADETAARIAAARVIDGFDQPYREAALTIDAPVAAGIALVPAHGTDGAQLLRRAEIGLAAALSVETRMAVYQADTDPHRPERLSLIGELRAGLRRDEFHLLYQPKLDLKSGRITGAEALVRWNHPARGLVYPDDFIMLAEQTGNIQHLTRWALRAGLTQARRWLDQGLPARVAINLSVRDLADDSLPVRIAGLLREAGLQPRSLVLEVTESAVMGEPDAAIAVLRHLSEMGIDLAIDDFGVGQSSLAYLRRLPVREIKLDKTFVRTLPRNPDDRTIVRSVTELGHNLGYRVTAEGVEDLETLDLLREFGCDHAQGYFIGKPLPPDGFARLAGHWRTPGGEPVAGPAILTR